MKQLKPLPACKQMSSGLFKNLQTNYLHKKSYIYIYIYIYILLFGPVKLELGVIPSGQEDYSRSEHLNFPGKELNVTDITGAIISLRKNNKLVTLGL